MVKTLDITYYHLDMLAIHTLYRSDLESLLGSLMSCDSSEDEDGDKELSMERSK